MFNTTYNHIFKSHNTSLPKCTVCIHIVSLSNTGFILSCNCQVYVKHLIVFRNVNLHLTSKSKATNSILRYRCVEFNLLLVINVHYASIRVRVIVISLARTNSRKYVLLRAVRHTDLHVHFGGILIQWVICDAWTLLILSEVFPCTHPRSSDAVDVI